MRERGGCWAAGRVVVDLTVQVKRATDRKVDIVTEVYTEDGEAVAKFSRGSAVLSSGTGRVDISVTTDGPRLWSPPPTQKPNLCTDGSVTPTDIYETSFGIRAITYRGDGLYVDGECIRIQGVIQHSDLGAIGMAFSTRAAERQLEHLQEIGVNAVCMSYNAPALELLHLTDRMGYLVLDEVFDSWARKKTDNECHVIFPEWHEADLILVIRRDRNHPSIYAWSIGNEVGEQTCCAERGFEIGKDHTAVVSEEDPTRPSTA